MEDSFDFELTKPFKYAHAGEQVEAKFIRFISPSKKQMEHNVFLKEAFFKAVKSMEGKSEKSKIKKEENETLSGEEVLAMLYMTPDVDMFKVLLSAIELFKTGVAMADGSEKLTQSMIDEISQDDIESMTGQYMINFTIASFLKSQGISKGT